MVLRTAIRHCGLCSGRRGLLSRSAPTAIAASTNAPLRRREDGNDGPFSVCRRARATTTSRWSKYQFGAPPKPPPRCMAVGVAEGRFVSTRSSGGASDAESKEQQRHETLRLKNTTHRPGPSPLSPPPHIPSSTSSGNSSSSSSSNIDGSSLLLKILGPRWSPYGRLARIDKPAGTLLLLFPCWWSIALAAPTHTLPDVGLMALFATGAFVMR